MKHFWLLPLLLAATGVRAGTSTSAAYTITADTLSAGGGHATNASYSGDASLGGIGGISTVTTPAETLKSGYIAQLTEVTAVQLAATLTTLNEATTQQITATATLDDSTTAVLLGGDLSWSVLSGPLGSISATGLATAGNVYQTTAATAQGSYRGVNGTLGFTINNTGTDDLGIYAGDGLPDAWQAQYFGVNNPLAAPGADASGTGQNNLFKYTAGLDPTNHAARFLTNTGGGSGGRTLTLSPRLPDRTYTVMYSGDLKNWQPLTGAIIQDNGQTRTVTDPDGVSTHKFYRVQISYP